MKTILLKLLPGVLAVVAVCAVVGIVKTNSNAATVAGPAPSYAQPSAPDERDAPGRGRSSSVTIHADPRPDDCGDGAILCGACGASLTRAGEVIDYGHASPQGYARQAGERVVYVQAAEPVLLAPAYYGPQYYNPQATAIDPFCEVRVNPIPYPAAYCPQPIGRIVREVRDLRHFRN